MSPSRSRRRAAGIPWTTSSLIDAQIVAGNPRYPLKAGFAFRSRMRALHLAIDLEGRDARLHQVAAHPEGVGQDPAGFAHVGDLGGRLQLDHRGPSVAFTRSSWTVSIAPVAGDRRQEAAPPVVVDEGPGVARVHGEPAPDRRFLVVRPLVELPAACVAASRRPGRRERDVVVPAAAPADPAPAEPRHRLLVGAPGRAPPGRAGVPSASSSWSSASACAAVRGKPSSTNPFRPSGWASRSRTSPMITASGTSSPASM